MFTLQEIKEAHVTIVKTGADFPKYVQRLIELGVARYETFVADGHTVYYDEGGQHLSAEAKYAALPVAAKSDTTGFTQALKIHQQGKTNYATFCSDSATAGVEKWIVDTNSMTCTYYDTDGNAILEEKIPVL